MLGVQNKLQVAKQRIYYDPSFRVVLQHHIPMLRKKIKPTNVPIDLVSYNEHGDFRMFLAEIGVPQHLHWLTMHLNGITNTVDWYPLENGLYLIDEDEELLVNTINLFRMNQIKSNKK
ncbi:hypothetical protein ABN214_15445 [Proteus terrae]|uniref:hypothetical protein n=1 Tax=Proteus terrae TaxID=1574161 RepID=UPI0032DAF5DA